MFIFIMRAGHFHASTGERGASRRTAAPTYDPLHGMTCQIQNLAPYTRARFGGAASNIVHVDDPGEGLDGGAGLGTDLEAAGDRDFDFAGGEVENHRDPAAATRLTGDYAFEAR